MLLTCLLAAGAMGLWHTVEFFEKEKVVGEEFYQQWNSVLRDNTRISYDWSYVLAWAGVASSLIAAILLSGAAVCLRSEREKEEQLNLQYLMPGLCAPPLRQKRFAKLLLLLIEPSVSFLSSNLVYPQKQPPYAYGGYPQPQMYPVHPYQGSQYGPYHY